MYVFIEKNQFQERSGQLLNINLEWNVAKNHGGSTGPGRKFTLHARYLNSDEAKLAFSAFLPPPPPKKKTPNQHDAAT